MNVEDRFWSKVTVSGSCWDWDAGTDRDGYGEFRIGPHKSRAHRLAYELLVGPIPQGTELDHLCRNRRCVNPDHLDPVTHRENMRRSPIAMNTINSQKTACSSGHALSAENTYLVRGWRECRACNRQAVARYRARKAARGSA